MATKTCSKGHAMDASWDICPYCKKTDYKSPLIKGGDNTGDNLTANSADVNDTSSANSKKTELVGAEDNKRPVMGWLVLLTGSKEGDDFSIRSGRTVIGSSRDADIIIEEDNLVSKEHAVMCIRNNKCFISDQMSANSTFVNGKELELNNAYQLNDNDVIQVGNTKLLFKGRY